jgi:hypothetical protein
VTVPAVPLPSNGGIRTPVDFTLKSGWSFDAKRRLFTSESGETFSPFSDLPNGARIVYKVPQLARATRKKLSAAERDLTRYMQVILPSGEKASRYRRAVQAWPAVEAAQMGPEVSLPKSPKP